jgi:hypothetical protein
LHPESLLRYLFSGISVSENMSKTGANASGSCICTNLSLFLPRKYLQKLNEEGYFRENLNAWKMSRGCSVKLKFSQKENFAHFAKLFEIFILAYW